MFALLLWVCVLGHPTDCRVVALVDGFASAEKCQAAAPLIVAGFLSLAKDDLEEREGVKPLCTSQGNFLINRFKA